MKRLCVFCGAGIGVKDEYRAQAKKLGESLFESGIGLVYGGGGLGLMGVVAKTVHDLGGEVIGVIPKALFDREAGYEALKDLRIVNSMHERKALMAELSDGFIAMPGGFGTLEEFFEVLTWAQLGFHQKPVGILNVQNFYSPLLAAMDHGVNEGFIKSDHRKLVLESADPKALIQLIQDFKPIDFDHAKWIGSLTKVT